MDLARACGLWLPIRGRGWGLWKEWQGKAQGWSLEPNLPQSLWPPGSRALRKGWCLPGRLSLAWSLCGWACGSPSVGCQFTLCEWEMVLCTRKEGREKSWAISREVPLPCQVGASMCSAQHFLCYNRTSLRRTSCLSLFMNISFFFCLGISGPLILFSYWSCRERSHHVEWINQNKR